MEGGGRPKKKEPGHYLGSGIAIGIALGVAYGAALGNMGLGIALGVSIGVAVGTALEEQARKRGELRELTPEEKRKTKLTNQIAVVAGVAVALAAVAIVLFLIMHH